jgi:CheY-like chemotaxis protein
MWARVSPRRCSRLTLQHRLCFRAGPFFANAIAYEHSTSKASGVDRVIRVTGIGPGETRSQPVLRDRTVRSMRQGRVLLADSHLCLLQGVHSLLEAVFAAVVMVADQGSLLETIERLEPDLVVIDLSMPVQDGTNVARQLMKRFPGLRVIALSVHDEPSVANQIRSEGVAGFVLKRTVATDLIPAVEAVLGGGSFVSPAVRE